MSLFGGRIKMGKWYNQVLVATVNFITLHYNGAIILVSVHIIGKFPSPLYRAFDEKEYASSFIEQGIFQMLPLQHYCAIEDSNRIDRDEGSGKVVINEYRPVITLDPKSGKILSQTSDYGPVYFHTGSINPRYILCFSGPQVDIKHLARQYGRYVIRIKRPATLVSDVASFLERCQNLPSTNWLYCVKVRYDKGESVTELPEPASEERASMSYSQKDSRFSNDSEYRLVSTLTLTGDAPPSKIEVNLHKRLEYVELVRLPVNQLD